MDYAWLMDSVFEEEKRETNKRYARVSIVCNLSANDLMNIYKHILHRDDNL